MYPYDFPMRNRGAGSSSALPQSWSDLKGSGLCAPGPGGPDWGGDSLDWFKGKSTELKGKSTGNYGKIYGNDGLTHWFTGNYGEKMEKMQNVGFLTGNNSYFMGKTETEHEEYLWLRFSLRNQSNDS